jgi:uncharacterized C2H2 Zn-finger protein
LPEVLELSVVVFYCSRCLDLFQQQSPYSRNVRGSN